MTEREIVEWVARAEVGEALPFGVSLIDVRRAMENIGYEIADGSIVNGPDMSEYAKAVLEHEGPEGPARIIA